MDFHKPYFSPLDEGFHNTYHQSSAAPSLEKPIFSAREIGTTVAESLGQGNNVLQNIDSAIKLGTSTMQIALMTPHTAAMGGRMKAYGKEAREQIREVAKAANIKITGVEMPTSSMNNLSGYDPRSKSVSKEAQRSSMDEVRDALHFIAEVGGGGGVDVFSQEFTRGISEANQWGDQKVNFAPHEGAEKEMIGQIVDTKTG